MSQELLDLVNRFGGSQAVEAMAARVGLTPEQTQSAMAALMPAVAGGMAKHVEANGPASLDAAAAPATEVVASEGAASDAAVAHGGGLLGSLFGGHDVTTAVASHAAQATGLDMSKLAALLPMVATLAAGALNHAGSGSAPATGGIGAMLGGLLGQIGGGTGRALPQAEPVLPVSSDLCSAAAAGPTRSTASWACCAADAMAKRGRTLDWGFPRWRDYGAETAAATVRGCDRDGCDAPGDRPAPKAPNRPERWWFCAAHAAEYNAGWNYFEGLSAAEARDREAGAAGESSFAGASHWRWGGRGDGSRSRAEIDALDALELEPHADLTAIKAAYRRLAKAYHPDAAPGDPAAAVRFQSIHAAYDILIRAEETREK